MGWVGSKSSLRSCRFFIRGFGSHVKLTLLYQPRDDSTFVVGVEVGRSGIEALVMMEVRGERSSPLGHPLCTTKQASKGRNGIFYLV